MVTLNVADETEGDTVGGDIGPQLLFGVDRRVILGVVVISVLTIVSYLPVLRAGFVWDDRLFTEARAVSRWGDIWHIWFTQGHVENELHYWPFLYTTFWVEHKIWGFNPVGFHAVNVLLHLGNSLLLWRLMNQLRVPAAWLIAAIFAVHPVHVEPVAWVIARKDVLSAMFYLGAVLAFLSFETTKDRRRYVLAVALFIPSLLTKSIAVTLPVTLLILAWFRRGRITVNDLLRTVPFFVTSLITTAIDLTWYTSRALPTDYSMIERVLVAPRALWWYVGKLLWPDNLAGIYPHWEVGPQHLWNWVFATAAVAVGVLLWLFRERIGRAPLAGAVFFVVTLSPVLGIIDNAYMNISFVTDRYQYLASVGVIAVIVTAAVKAKDKLPKKSAPVAAAVAGCILLVFGALTWQHASNYRNNETFYTHILATNPDVPVAWLELSRLLGEEARYDELVEITLEGIDLMVAVDSDLAVSIQAYLHNTAGVAYVRLEQIEQAEQHFRKALEVEPGHENATSNLSNLLQQEDRFQEAAALSADSEIEDPDLLAASGLEQQQAGDYEAAEQSYREALALDPENYAAIINLAGVLRITGRYDEAAALYNSAIEIWPDSAEVPTAMGFLEYDRGNYRASEDFFRDALEISRSQSSALIGLGSLYNTLENYEEALPILERAAEAAPDDAGVYSARGVTLFYLGRVDEAIADLELAISLDPDLQQAHDNLQAIQQSLQ